MLFIEDIIDGWVEPYRKSVDDGYRKIVSQFPNPFVADMFFLIFLSVIYYWLIGMIYCVIDMLKKPNAFSIYKIQSQVQFNYKTDFGKLSYQLVVNQLLAIAIYLLYLIFKYRYIGVQEILPGPCRLIYDLVCITIIGEIAFYYSHRLLHHRTLYKWIHKRHHEYQAPIALGAIYCHPIEHLVSNVFSLMLGPQLMHSHNLVNYVWIMIVIFTTLNSHSGYHFPGMIVTPGFHDFHHMKFNTNYGILGILDRLHGTDELFRKSKYYQMSRSYFTLSPPREFFHTD